MAETPKSRGGEPRRFAPLTKDVLLTKYKSEIVMNYKNLANLNPLIMDFMSRTHHGWFDFVTLVELDDEGNEVCLVPGDSAEEGAIKLSYGKSRRTARLTFTLLTTKYPRLKVPKGRLRSFPVMVRTDDRGPLVVISLRENELEVSESAGKKKKKSAATESSKPTEETPGENKVAATEEPKEE